MIILTMGDVTEAIDLGRDVVVHEQRVAVPARVPGVAALFGGERQVLLPRYAFGGRKLMISPGLWQSQL